MVICIFASLCLPRKGGGIARPLHNISRTIRFEWSSPRPRWVADCLLQCWEWMWCLPAVPHAIRLDPTRPIQSFHPSEKAGCLYRLTSALGELSRWNKFKSVDLVCQVTKARLASVRQWYSSDPSRIYFSRALHLTSFKPNLTQHSHFIWHNISLIVIYRWLVGFPTTSSQSEKFLHVRFACSSSYSPSQQGKNLHFCSRHKLTPSAVNYTM